MIQKRKQTGIIVFGHTRPQELKNVLESLRLQQTVHDIHVWLDGHFEKKRLFERVEECRDLVRKKFPEVQLSAMNGNIGIEKLTIDGLSCMSLGYERIIVLEDDCFPTASAVQVFEEALDDIADLPEVYSTYGHHFLTESEKETITRFQGWGWATTTEKLLTVLAELKKCFCMSEPEYLEWVAQNLNQNVIAGLNVTPGRNCIDVLSKFFSWDSCTCLLTAQMGLKHKKTPKRVVYNCGMGEDSGHFPKNDKFRCPPFNMIKPDEVWNYFDDSHVDRPNDILSDRCKQTGPRPTAFSDNQHGEALFAQGDMNGALNAFKKALNTDPTFVTAHNNLGVLYWQTGETAKAVEHLSKALAVSPDNKYAVLNYGEILRSMDQKIDAESLYSSYLKHHPDDGEISERLRTL